MELGAKFKYSSLVVIFGGSGALLALALLLSGVSYHIGKLCHINFYRSRESFWGPLLSVSILSLIIQILIIGHCILCVVEPSDNRLQFWRLRQSRSSRDSPLTFSHGITRRQALRRVRRILQLQWRAVLIAALIVFHTAFMAQALLRAGDVTTYSLDDVMPWITCLLDSGGNPDECLSYAKQLGPNGKTVMAAWCLLAVCCSFHLS